MTEYLSQNQFNRYSSQTAQKGLAKLSIYIYEGAKAVINFIKSMINMYLGKY